MWSRLLEESHVGEEGDRGNVRDLTFNVKFKMPNRDVQLSEQVHGIIMI